MDDGIPAWLIWVWVLLMIAGLVVMATAGYVIYHFLMKVW